MGVIKNRNTKRREKVDNILEFNLFMLDMYLSNPEIKYYREENKVLGYIENDIYFTYYEPR